MDWILDLFYLASISAVLTLGQYSMHGSRVCRGLSLHERLLLRAGRRHVRLHRVPLQRQREFHQVRLGLGRSGGSHDAEGATGPWGRGVSRDWGGRDAEWARGGQRGPNCAKGPVGTDLTEIWINQKTYFPEIHVYSDSPKLINQKYSSSDNKMLCDEVRLVKV